MPGRQQPSTWRPRLGSPERIRLSDSPQVSLLVRMNGIIAWIATNTWVDTRKKLDQNLVSIVEREPILVKKILFADYAKRDKPNQEQPIA